MQLRSLHLYGKRWMVLRLTTPFASNSSALFCLGSLLLLSGCHHSVSVPPAAVRAIPLNNPRMLQASAVSPPLPPNIAAVAQVQSLPLYQKAQQACRQKQFVKAADLLEKLAATPGLSAEQLKFCHTQSDLCRKDAGMKLRYASLLPKLGSTPKPTQRPIDADCGPKALAIACQQLGIQAEIAALHKSAGTDSRGTTMEGLAKAAQGLHLKTEALQVSREALPSVQTPAICWVHSNHYIALLQLSGSGEDGKAIIHDPNQTSEQLVTQEQLLRMSGGYLLLVHR